jgi:hypothetical protein
MSVNVVDKIKQHLEDSHNDVSVCLTFQNETILNQLLQKLQLASQDSLAANVKNLGQFTTTCWWLTDGTVAEATRCCTTNKLSFDRYRMSQCVEIPLTLHLKTLKGFYLNNHPSLHIKLGHKQYPLATTTTPTTMAPSIDTHNCSFSKLNVQTHSKNCQPTLKITQQYFAHSYYFQIKTGVIFELLTCTPIHHSCCESERLLFNEPASHRFQLIAHGKHSFAKTSNGKHSFAKTSNGKHLFAKTSNGNTIDILKSTVNTLHNVLQLFHSKLEAVVN